MSRTIRYIPLMAVVFALAACGENASSPTASAVPQIRHEENGGLGVGGSATGGPGSTTDPTTTTTQSDSTTFENGGLGVGGS